MVSKSISFALKLSSDQDAEQRQVTGEVALLGAIVRTAIRDWLVYRKSPNVQYRKMAEDARSWLFEEGEFDSSFDTYCHFLGADPGTIRNQVCATARKLGCRTPEVMNVNTGRYRERRKFDSTPVSQLL